MDCKRSGVTVYEKSGAPAVWTLAGILSWSTAPGMGFAAVASAGAGGSAGAGARCAGPVALATGALRGGGATGVVAMTWISGSFAVEPSLSLEASCAATIPGAIAAAKVTPVKSLRKAVHDPESCKPPSKPLAARMCEPYPPTSTLPSHEYLALGIIFQSQPGTFGNEGTPPHISR